jgi:hypothetical protein
MEGHSSGGPGTYWRGNTDDPSGMLLVLFDGEEGDGVCTVVTKTKVTSMKSTYRLAHSP